MPVDDWIIKGMVPINGKSDYHPGGLLVNESLANDILALTFNPELTEMRLKEIVYENRIIYYQP